MTILETEKQIIQYVEQIKLLDDFSSKLKAKVRALKTYQRNLNDFIDSAEKEWIKKDDSSQSEHLNPELGL